MFLIKNILTKIYFHPFCMFLTIIVILTGLFKQFLILFSIIIFHELGHFLLAYIFEWNIDKISIYPYGGCVKFNEKLNKSIKEEFIILISGPLFQMFLFIIFTILFNLNYITLKDYLLIKSYHYTLLSFNLLPIYPLDGGKLLNLITNYLLPYKKSNKIIIYFSYILVFILIFYYKNINFLLMGLFLIIEITTYLKNQEFLYNNLLLERYLQKYYFKRFSVIDNKDKMYRNRNHILKLNKKYIDEDIYLKERFNYEKY